MSKITAADLATIEYKGFTISPYYDLGEEWCTSVFDETGKQLYEDYTAGGSTLQEAIEYAQSWVDIELAKRAIAPRFIALLEQARAEGFTTEQIAYGLLRGSFQYSERGFFLEVDVCEIPLQNICCE